MTADEKNRFDGYAKTVTPYNVTPTDDLERQIAEACISAGYSMLADMPHEMEKAETKDYMRGGRLGHTPAGAGEDKLLRFINIQFDWILPRYMWQEVDTYHFFERNSMSTMHRIMNMDIDTVCSPYVSVAAKTTLAMLIDDFRHADDSNRLERWLKLKANVPEGLLLASRCSTNYATLKTIWKQRRGHRNIEWSIFRDWISTLPRARELGVAD